MSSLYGGLYCGVTVFSFVPSRGQVDLFYSVAMPIVDTLGAMGLPTFFHIDTTNSEQSR
jgi:hypothetical protein